MNPHAPTAQEVRMGLDYLDAFAPAPDRPALVWRAVGCGVLVGLAIVWRML